MEENIQLSTVLLQRAETEKEDALHTYESVAYYNKLAHSAVAEGDSTLAKANSTLHVLQSFQSEVQKSSESSDIALRSVPAVKEQIRNTEEVVEKAEEVKV